jgi:hypothetical protein
MDNTPESSDASSDLSLPNTNIDDVFVKLRTLLAIPTVDRSPEWQGAMSPLINAIGLDFLNQNNSEVALVDITLIALAAQKGSKVAKKRELRPIRWIAIAPPSISTLFHDIEEARCAIRVLHPLSGDWVEKYVCHELMTNKWPVLAPLLVEWLLKISTSVEDFLRAFNGIAREPDVEYMAWISSAFECATKLLGKSHLFAGAGMMSEAAELAVRLASNIPSNLVPTDTKAKQLAINSLLGLVSQVSSVEPSVLVQGAVVSAISGLSALSGADGESEPEDLERMCQRTISLLGLMMPNADKTHLSHYREIWSAYRRSLKKADQLLKIAARDRPVLSLLETKLYEEDISNELGVTAGLEHVLCELIVNWDDYFAIHFNDPAVQQLSSRIEELCRQLGVKRFGQIGELAAFDPVHHYLPDNLSLPPGKVKIIKPGISLGRSDGTSRVLLMASVTPLNAP